MYKTSKLALFCLTIVGLSAATLATSKSEEPVVPKYHARYDVFEVVPGGTSRIIFGQQRFSLKPGASQGTEQQQGYPHKEGRYRKHSLFTTVHGSEFPVFVDVSYEFEANDKPGIVIKHEKVKVWRKTDLTLAASEDGRHVVVFRIDVLPEG